MICSYVLSVSSLPLSVTVHSCHAYVNLSCFVRQGSFTATLCSGSSPSPTRQRAGPARKTISLHEIFKPAHLKFTVRIWPQTDIHTTSSLVPRPLPDFISQPIFCHSCKIKSGSGLGTRLHNFRKRSHTSVGLVQARPN